MFSIFNVFNVISDIKWNIDNLCDMVYLVFINYVCIWVCGNIVKYKFVGICFCVLFGKGYNVIDDFVVFKLYVFYYFVVVYV